MRPPHDGRTRLERLRELRRLDRGEATYRAPELQAGIDAAMYAVEAVLSGDPARVAAAAAWLREPVRTSDDDPDDRAWGRAPVWDRLPPPMPRPAPSAEERDAEKVRQERIERECLGLLACLRTSCPPVRFPTLPPMPPWPPRSRWTEDWAQGTAELDLDRKHVADRPDVRFVGLKSRAPRLSEAEFERAGGGAADPPREIRGRWSETEGWVPEER